MGGCQRVSSSQQKTAGQPSTSAENLPPSFASLALDHRSSPDLLNGGQGDQCRPAQQELGRNQSEADRTAGAGRADELSGASTNGCSSPPAELQGDTPPVSKLSLFTGMELVTKEVSPWIRETEDDSAEVAAGSKAQSLSGSTVNTTACSSALSNSSQPVSAFSFLNL